MKKALYIICTAALCGFWISNANAVDITQTAAGDPVTLTTANVAGDPGFTFNPSTGVIMDGESDETSFAISAYHKATINKASGQAYGMAADVNKLFFMDISGDSVTATITGTTSTAAFSGDWVTM